MSTDVCTLYISAFKGLSVRFYSLLLDLDSLGHGEVNVHVLRLLKEGFGQQRQQQGESGDGATHVSSEVNLPSDLLNLGDLLLGQLGQVLDSSELLDPLLVARSGHGDHPLAASPEKESSGRVDLAASFRRDAVGDTLEDGLEGSSSGRVAEERGERAVGLGDDAVLGLDVEDGLDVGEDEGVVLELVDNGLVLGHLEDGLEVLWPEQREREAEKSVAVPILRSYVASRDEQTEQVKPLT